MADKKRIAFGASAGIAAIVATLLGGIYDREGGYVNNKNDRGGETHSGITIGTARENGYTGKMIDFKRACYSDKDVCADKIYYEKYITPYVPVLLIDEGVGSELVDTSVISGRARPNKWFQQSLNKVCGSTPTGKPLLTVDGKIGNGTLSYTKSCRKYMTPPKFCNAMLDSLDGLQLDFFKAIVRNNPSQRVFYKGWTTHRIGNVDRRLCDKSPTHT